MTRRSNTTMVKHVLCSDGFRYLGKKQKLTNPPELNIQPKELQRPLQKEDFDNIYAVPTSHLLEISPSRLKSLESKFSQT